MVRSSGERSVQRSGLVIGESGRSQVAEVVEENCLAVRKSTRGEGETGKLGEAALAFLRPWKRKRDGNRLASTPRGQGVLGTGPLK